MTPGLVPRLLDEPLRARLRDIAHVRYDLVVEDFGEPGVAEALGGAEVLLTCWGCPPIDEPVLAVAPSLRAVVHAAGTVKSLITDACWRRGVLVSSAAAANAIPVAEYTVAMIILANKRAFPIMAEYPTVSETGRHWETVYPDIGNRGKTVGVVGASRVGRHVLALLRPYDLRVLLADPTIGPAEASELGAILVPLDDLVRASDVVTIHAPSLPETHHLFGARRIALLRDGATLINTARGRLIDTEALTVELASGRINAVLDVTDPEPLPAGSALFSLPNVVLTPHIAGALGTELSRLGAVAVDELERYARGEPFAHGVDPSRLSALA